MDQQRHDDFAENVVRHQHRLFGFILTLVPNRADADELFQQTCLSLWKNWEQYDPGREFVPWACAFARNHVFNYLRKQRSRGVLLQSDVVEQLAVETENEAAEADSRMNLLRECIAELPEIQQRLVAAFYKGQSVATLAAEADTTTNAIYKSLRRIRAALQRCVHKKMAGGAP